jgi:DeoR family fructose operon transcriptional repressor
MMLNCILVPLIRVNILYFHGGDFLFSEERCIKIAEILREKSSIKVNELSELFDVSESTIRRDLRDMENNGLLSRTHGGAVSACGTRFEPTFKEKEVDKHKEKINVGIVAAKLIEDGDTIILDAGTTTLEVAKNITAKNITVITNAIDIAYVLSEKQEIEVIVTGGFLRTTTRALVGNITENILKEFKVDKAFIGTNGISIEDGLTTPNYIEAQAKKAMINSAHAVIVVTDSSKFDNVFFSVISPIDRVTTIVTNKEIDEETRREFEKAKIEIIIS